MNKSLLRGVFIALVILTLLFILFRSRTPFGKSNSSFAIDPGKEITKIEMSSGRQKLILEKNGEIWEINGKTEARKSGVLFIIRVLKEIKIKSPVSAELFENEITGKNVIPVKVKVYENHRQLKTFLVYKTKSNPYGNIMKIKESTKPFIAYVPGYEGDIGSGFILNELFWQPYTVFNLLPSEISSVNFENLSDTSSSFQILNRPPHYFLSCSTGNLTGWDSSLVTRYISYFARVPFESWAFEIKSDEKKSILESQPLYRITVTTSGGVKSVLSLWPRSTVQNGAITNDSDRLLGKADENSELYVIRYFDIDPLIKKRSYFFPQ